ncbi:ribbon-helix-helix protein, CopG family [Novosphingobium naphthalenivorans]|nr:ribbon-helix-helix protein, CopG family [Novosphingobium naphthalenivorans]
MAQAQKSEFVGFRANARLLGALEERAHLAGVSVSEMLRRILLAHVF